MRSINPFGQFEESTGKLGKLPFDMDAFFETKTNREEFEKLKNEVDVLKARFEKMQKDENRAYYISISSMILSVLALTVCVLRFVHFI